MISRKLQQIVCSPRAYPDGSRVDRPVVCIYRRGETPLYEEDAWNATVMLLGASLSVAQTADTANSDRGTGTPATQNADNNRGHDWGWLGLLGLVGLSGLRGRKQYGSEKERDVTNIRRAA